VYFAARIKERRKHDKFPYYVTTIVEIRNVPGYWVPQMWKRKTKRSYAWTYVCTDTRREIRTKWSAIYIFVIRKRFKQKIIRARRRKIEYFLNIISMRNSLVLFWPKKKKTIATYHRYEVAVLYTVHEL